MIPKHKYHSTILGNTVKVYINDILHLCYHQNRFLGMQSWKQDKNHYCIELILKGGKILCEYDNHDKWIEVIKLLDSNIE